MANPFVLNRTSDTAPAHMAAQLKPLSASEAAGWLANYTPSESVAALQLLNPATIQDVLAQMPGRQMNAVIDAAPADTARQWRVNRTYSDDSVGRLMDPALAVFNPATTVAQTIDILRDLVKTAFITYGYVTEGPGKLLGVITMRDLLFAEGHVTLADVMLKDVFTLRPDMPLSDAMKQVLGRHYPVYPVCDASGALVGLVRGSAMFEEQAFEITAQPGTMVGVEKEERLATRWSQSFKYRHPWLQLNLLTAFAAGAVVGIFEGTVEKLVALAVFLPVLAGQSGNTGCQALAVTLRGLTLGELKPGSERKLVMKEGLLGLLNGAFTGLIAGAGMFAYATMQKSPHALMLGAVVWLALVGACVVSGICGAMIPLTLKRLGQDPATASSIFLTTATDVVSMGLLLGLATILIKF